MAKFSGISLVKPTEAQGYLMAAQGMLEGALQLGGLAHSPYFALTLLCGHSCEAALKSLLANNGISAKVLSKRPYGHNIIKLWSAADSAGFSLPKPMPDWVVQLSNVYDKPFHLRYPLGFHGILLPNQNTMLQGTEALVSLTVSCVS